MTGVVAALEAHYRGRPVGQQVDDLALSLVSPLGSYDDNALAHAYYPK